MAADTKMIDAVVKRIDHTDSAPAPDHPGAFVLGMTAGIGPSGDDSADNFQVVVCNAAWLAERAALNSAYWPRGHPIVDRFDENHINDAFRH
jgi:hypothetical protein